MKKRLMKILHPLLLNLVWLIYRLLYSTYRFEVKNVELREKGRSLSPNKSFLFSIWHEQVLLVMSATAWTEPYIALASKSKDGDFAATIAQRLGFTPIRGSSKKNNIDKGGKEALFEYIHRLKKGTSGGITVDGPRGPRRQCKPGIIVMAQKSGSPIIPLVAQASSYWEFNSWDRFKVAKPFSTITLMYGEPIIINADITENEVTETTRYVDARMENLDLELLAAL